MNVTEFRDLVRNAGGKIDLIGGGSIEIGADRDSDVDIHGELGHLIAWVSGDVEGENQVTTALSMASGVINEINVLMRVAQKMGISIAGVEPVRITNPSDVTLKADNEQISKALTLCRDALTRKMADYAQVSNEKNGERSAFKASIEILAEHLRG